MLQYHMLSSVSILKTTFYSAERSVLMGPVYADRYETKYECSIIIPIMYMI